MKYEVRKPSWKQIFSARARGRAVRSMKQRAVNPDYGKKGMGWIINPHKALYNKAYHKTTFNLFKW